MILSQSRHLSGYLTLEKPGASGFSTLVHYSIFSAQSVLDAADAIAVRLIEVVPVHLVVVEARVSVPRVRT